MKVNNFSFTIIFIFYFLSTGCNSNTEPQVPSIIQEELLIKEDKSPTTQMPEDSCRELLLQVLQGSNLHQIMDVAPNYDYFIDRETSSFLRLKIFEKTEIREQATLGWVEIQLNNNEIRDVTIDPINYRLITFDTILFQKYKTACTKLIPNSKKTRVYQAQKGTAMTNSRFVLNINGTSLFDFSNGLLKEKLKFNSKLILIDTLNEWGKVVYFNDTLLVKMEDIHQSDMEDFANLSLKEKIENYFNDEAQLKEISEPYYSNFKINFKGISIEKGYQILKLLLGQKEREELSPYLPKQELISSKKNFSFIHEPVIPSQHHEFSFSYNGGETIGKLMKHGKDSVTIEIIISAD